MTTPHHPWSRTWLTKARRWRFHSLRSGLAATAIAAVIASSVTAVAVHSQTVQPAPGGNLSPEAAQAAPELPNFVSLVKTVKPAVVSVRVRSATAPQVLTDDGGLFPFEPFEGTPFERFFGDRSESQKRPERAPRQSRMNGRVIGVNTAIYSPSGGSVGIAFSIPASTAKWVVDQLKEHGKVERSWLGVRVQAVDKSIADGLGMNAPNGVLIAQAETGSPAAKAGLKPGDVIVSVNGAEVQNPRDLARKVATVAVDTTVKLDIVRDGSRQTVEATLARMKTESSQHLASGEPTVDQPGKLGMTVAPAGEVNGAGEQGLAILQVDPQGKAAEVGLAAGDVIIRAGEQQLGNVGDLNDAMALASAKGKSAVLVLVRRGETQRYVAVPIA